MFQQQKFNFPLFPASGGSTSRVEPTASAATLVTAGDTQTVEKNSDTDLISLPSPKKNTSNGNDYDLSPDQLPTHIQNAVAYAFNQQAVEAFLFLGVGLLKTLGNPTSMDNGTWLCIRFVDPIPCQPGELVIITREAPRK